MKFYHYLLSATALLMVSCAGGGRSQSAPRKVKYESAKLESSSSQQALFPGKVVAATDVNIGFRVPGIIEEICVVDGAFVRKGTLIARLDSRDYALQLSATQAEYDAIKAEVDRVVALFADQSVSANDYDKATSGLRAISAKLEAHKNALADTELRAPFDGYIHKSTFDRGEAVAAGTPLMTLISATPEITVDIPAAYHLKENSLESAIATIEIYPDKKFNLNLKSVSPKANLNQLYRATFSVDAADGTLPSVGVSAMVEMNYSVAETSNVIIPFAAVTQRGGKSSVWVVDNGKLSLKEVEVVEIKSDGRAVISSGLAEGEKVVVAGLSSLKEGQEVSLLEEPSPSNIGAVK